MDPQIQQIYNYLLKYGWRVKENSRWNKLKSKITGIYTVKLTGCVRFTIPPQPGALYNVDGTKQPFMIPGAEVPEDCLVRVWLDGNLHEAPRAIEVLNDKGKPLAYKERKYLNAWAYNEGEKPDSFWKLLWYELTKPRYI